MKPIAFAFVFLLAPLLRGSAQVSVEVVLEQEQFLPSEALPAAVRITNRSGQTLRLGGEPDWLTFSVESRDGFVVVKNGEVPVVGEFVLESSKVATKRVDLAPYFNLARPGRYSVSATVRIQAWDGQETSGPKDFGIIEGAKLWSREFGVPAPGGATNQTPEVRKYALQQANYLRSQLKLYLRLTDAAETKVLKVFPVGPMASFSRPEPQLDKLSNLHLLYQTGARSFSYTVINPDGDIILRQTYDYLNSRPRLAEDKEGRFGVTGGVRHPTFSDLPAPKPSGDDVTTPKR